MSQHSGNEPALTRHERAAEIEPTLITNAFFNTLTFKVQNIELIKINLSDSSGKGGVLFYTREAAS